MQQSGRSRAFWVICCAGVLLLAAGTLIADQYLSDFPAPASNALYGLFLALLTIFATPIVSESGKLFLDALREERLARQLLAAREGQPPRYTEGDLVRVVERATTGAVDRLELTISRLDVLPAKVFELAEELGRVDERLRAVEAARTEGVTVSDVERAVSQIFVDQLAPAIGRLSPLPAQMLDLANRVGRLEQRLESLEPAELKVAAGAESEPEAVRPEGND